MNRQSTNISATVALLAILSACGQTRSMTLGAAPSDLFDPVAPIEVTASYSIADRHDPIIAGAADGISQGVKSGFKASLDGAFAFGPAGGYASAALLMLAPVFAAVGGVYGAVASHPAEKVKEAISSLERLYGDAELLGALDDMLTEKLEKLGLPLVPPCPELEEPRRAKSETRMTDSQPDCSVDARRNRLKLYTYYGFHQEGTYSPDLSLVIEVLAKASGPSAEGWEVKMRWEYRSAEVDLFEATKDEAALLRHWISAGQRQLAEQIVNDLILRPKSVRVTGTYYSHAARNNFVPDAGEPATVRRLPLRSRLVYVPEQRLNE